MSNENYDPTKSVFPQLPDLDTVPEEVRFEKHPDMCGTLGYVSVLFFATVGGDDCTCVSAKALRIVEAPNLSNRGHVRTFVDREFDSVDAAVSYAQAWIALNHKTSLERMSKMIELAEADVAKGMTVRTAHENILKGLYAEEAGLTRTEFEWTCPETGEVTGTLDASEVSTKNKLIDRLSTMMDSMSILDELAKALQEAASAESTPGSKSLPVIEASYDDKMPEEVDEFPQGDLGAKGEVSEEGEFRYPVFHLGKGEA